jgi:uncharacterized repeat protein (TIGR02543 family)
MSISVPFPLNTYGALADEYIQSSFPYRARIENCYYGSSNPESNFLIEGFEDSDNVSASLDELAVLVDELTAKSTDSGAIPLVLPPGNYFTGNQSYGPGTYVCTPTSNTGLYYKDANIILDSTSEDDQFIFVSTQNGILFSNCTMTITGPMLPSNIFWFAPVNFISVLNDDYITPRDTVTAEMFGIFITNGPAGQPPAGITIQHTNVTGRLFSKNAFIGFENGNCTVNSPYDTSFLTYYGNGNTSGSVGGSIPVRHGRNVTVLGKRSLERTGNRFIGWNTEADGSGTSYLPGDQIEVGTTNITLYAQWQSDNIPCYVKGSLICTPRGFVTVESMKAGDNILTKGEIHNNKFITNENVKTENIKLVNKFKVFDLNSESRPICIKKNALGKNQPFNDLYVSPNHGLLVQNKLVAARHLVNGTTIYQDMECDEVEYYHVKCEKHSAIFANGVLSESFLDINNKDVLENSIKVKHIPVKKPIKHKLSSIKHEKFV